MNLKMSCSDVVELAALRELADPTNPLSRQLIDERLAADVPPDPLFMSQLQRAWRDGRLNSRELAFCEKMGIRPLTYLKMRQVAKPEHKGETAFDVVKRRVFDL